MVTCMLFSFAWFKENMMLILWPVKLGMKILGSGMLLVFRGEISCRDLCPVFTLLPAFYVMTGYSLNRVQKELADCIMASL